MGHIGIIVDWDGRNYAACPSDDDIACVATGKSLQELKDNMEAALAAHAAGLLEDSLNLKKRSYSCLLVQRLYIIFFIFQSILH